MEEVTGERLCRDRVCGIGSGKAAMAARIRVPSDKDPARRAAETRAFGAARREVLLAALLARIDRVSEEIAGLAETTERLLEPDEEQLQQAEPVPGWARRAAQDALAGTGPDMTRFPTGAHLVSRAGRSPLDHQSGKRTGRARHKKGNKYLGAVTGETAVAAGKTHTREGARYRKIARRRGKNKACAAPGSTQLKACHKLPSDPGMRYADPGPDYYEQQAAIRRKIACHAREIDAPGLEVTICRPAPEPEPGSHANTPAA